MSRRILAAVVMGLGLTGIAYALAPTAPAVRAGDVWEYKVVSEKEMATANDKGPISQVADDLGKIGADGWELITIRQSAGLPDYYFFKRRK